MRPHNTGHWTIDGARTSQFENHLRAVLDLPLGDPSSTEGVDGNGQHLRRGRSTKFHRRCCTALPVTRRLTGAAVRQTGTARSQGGSCHLLRR